MKRISQGISAVLALVMLLALLPGTALAGDAVTSLDILYDAEMIFPTTRLTGRQVTEGIFAAVQSPKKGTFSNSDDWYVWGNPGDTSSWTCLCCRSENALDENNYNAGFTSLYDSDAALTSGGEYYFRFDLLGQAKWFDQQNLPTVTVNGAAADYVYYVGGELIVYRRVFLNETDDCVWAVTMDPSEAVVQKGATKQFTAEAHGTVTAVT